MLCNFEYHQSGININVSTFPDAAAHIEQHGVPNSMVLVNERTVPSFALELAILIARREATAIPVNFDYRLIGQPLPHHDEIVTLLDLATFNAKVHEPGIFLVAHPPTAQELHERDFHDTDIDEQSTIADLIGSDPFS